MKYNNISYIDKLDQLQKAFEYSTKLAEAIGVSRRTLPNWLVCANYKAFALRRLPVGPPQLLSYSVAVAVYSVVLLFARSNNGSFFTQSPPPDLN